MGKESQKNNLEKIRGPLLRPNLASFERWGPSQKGDWLRAATTFFCQAVLPSCPMPVSFFETVPER